jgi:hypothetical protein
MQTTPQSNGYANGTDGRWHGAIWGLVGFAAVLEAAISYVAVVIIQLLGETCGQEVTNEVVLRGMVAMALLVVATITPWIVCVATSRHTGRFLAFAALGSLPAWVGLAMATNPTFWDGCLFSF